MSESKATNPKNDKDKKLNNNKSSEPNNNDIDDIKSPRANRKPLHEHTEFAVLVKNLTRKFGKHTILDNVNLSLPKGAIYGLLGPSGCGKTTLLKCLLGRLAPTTGSILVFNEIPG